MCVCVCVCCACVGVCVPGSRSIELIEADELVSADSGVESVEYQQPHRILRHVVDDALEQVADLWRKDE